MNTSIYYVYIYKMYRYIFLKEYQKTGIFWKPMGENEKISKYAHLVFKISQTSDTLLIIGV